MMVLVLLAVFAGYLSYFANRARTALKELDPAAVVQAAERAARR
ncbi:MAG: hypothetical protein N2690_01175 [Rhodocyclaceae bacterium]|nr:hypothetical protein [Rhodocyclaceae bacterium]